MAKRQVSIFINGKEVENTLAAILAKKREITNQLKRMQIGSQEYDAAIANLKSLDGAIDQHKAKLRGVESALGTMKAAGAQLFAVLGAGFAVKELLDLGTQMEVLGAKAETVLGSALDQVTAKAEANAAAMGLTTGAYIDQTTAIADLLIPMGFQRDMAADMGTQLVDLSGALAEWSGGQLDAAGVSDLLAKALLGERDGLKAVGIAISEADVSARLAAEGKDKLTGKALEQAKAMATLALVLEKSTDAQAAYAKNSDTLIRTQAEVAAVIQEVKERIATALLPVFKFLAVALLEAIGFLVKWGTVLAGLPKFISDNRVVIIALLTAVAGLNANLIITNSLMLISSARLALVSAGSAAAAAKIGLMTIAQRALNVAMRLNPLGLVITAISLLVAGLKLAYDRFEGFRRLVDNVSNAVKNFFGIASKGSPAAKAMDAVAASTEKATEKVEETSTAVDKLTTDLGKMPKDPMGGLKKSADDAKKAAEETAKELEKLLKVVQTFQDEASTALLDDDAQALDKIRKRYDAEIALALELERRGVTQATDLRLELERLKNDALREEEGKRLVAKAIASEEEWKADQERIERFNAEKAAVEKKLFDETRKVLFDEFENQRLDLEANFQRQLEQAEAYGISTVEIRAAYEAEKARIAKEFQEKTLNDTLERQKKEMQALASSYSAFADIVGAALTLLADESKEFAGISRLLTLVQIGLRTAEGLAAATAAGAGLTFPANLGAIAAGVSTVLTNMAAARRALSAVPQRKEGGYVDVVGADDGRTYHAQVLGRTSTGMLPSHPVVVSTVGGPVLASEAGREYFVSNHAMRDRRVFNYVQAIDNIVRHPQMREGGFVSNATAGEAKSATQTPDNANMAALLADFNVLLRAFMEKDFVAVVPDQTILDMRQREATIARFGGGG